jgi:hypothetical protein
MCHSFHGMRLCQNPPLPQFVMYTITLNTPRYNLYIFFNNLNNSTIFFLKNLTNHNYLFVVIPNYKI